KDGLMQFTLEDKQFRHIDVFNVWIKLGDYNFTESGGITLDLLNRVWVSTFPKGIFVYDPSSHSASIPFRDSIIENNISIASSIYCDRDSMIWLSYHGHKGIYQVIPSSPVVTHYQKNVVDVGSR